ncbi:MAG: hypothetical protein ABIV43_00765 [Candidatus Saccharimonadales bacterium]
MSLERNPVSKFKKDAAKHAADDYEEYTFFTNQYLTSAQKVELMKICAEKLEAPLLIKDIEAIRSALDTTQQDLRKRYLHIDETVDLSYSLELTRVTTYSVDNETNKSVARLNKTKQEYLNKSSMAGVMPISFPSIGTRTTEAVLSDLTEHVDILTSLGNKLAYTVSFNVELVSDKYDENVQVEIYCNDPLKFDFESRNLELPDYPSTNLNMGLMEQILAVPSASNYSVAAHKDDSEFYAKLANHDHTVRSNLSVLNPNQPKLVFDEAVFIFGNLSFEPIKLQAKIYSKFLKIPVVQELVIDLSNSEQTIKLEYPPED